MLPLIRALHPKDFNSNTQTRTNLDPVDVMSGLQAGTLDPEDVTAHFQTETLDPNDIMSCLIPKKHSITPRQPLVLTDSNP